jgi:hypothetical protein
VNMNKLISKIARKIDPPEPPRTTGQWVRSLSGAIIWDPWDMDAPPDHDPTPGILRQLDLIEERRRQRGDCREPTPEQLEDGRRAFEEAIADIRARRQAVRDFSAQVERERAERAGGAG